MRGLRWAAVLVFTCTADTALAANTDFDVAFDQCAEYVGIGLVPKARARSLVPAAYSLAGGETNALIVVRVVECAVVAVDGKNPQAARTAQIGITITGPNATAHIDNYLLWYVTDLGTLKGKFESAGLSCGDDQQLSFDITPVSAPSPLSIDVAAAQLPAYTLQGQAATPNTTPVFFSANWWADGREGRLRLHMDFPQIRFGGASVTLNTPAGTPLAQLIGGTSMQFPLLDSYNTFGPVVMQVRKQ